MEVHSDSTRGIDTVRARSRCRKEILEEFGIPAGEPIRPAYRVLLQDAAGNNVSESGVSIVAALNSGDGTLRGTTELDTDENGMAAFSNLRILGATGAHHIRFTAAKVSVAVLK